IEKLEPVHGRQVEVEKHDIGGPLARVKQALLAGGGLDELEGAARKKLAHEVAGDFLVIDDEHPGHRMRARRAIERAEQRLGLDRLYEKVIGAEASRLAVLLRRRGDDHRNVLRQLALLDLDQKAPAILADQDDVEENRRR